MGSQQSDGEWTAVSLRQSVLTRLEAFRDAYSMPANNTAVDRLLTIAEEAGIPITATDSTSVTDEVNLDNVNDVQGFVIDTADGSGMELIGVDGSHARVISQIDAPTAKVQPFNQAQITNGTVYCPACANAICSYRMSPFLPSIETGLFDEFTITCPTCNSERKDFTLFVAQGTLTPQAAALRTAMQAYFAALLILDPLTDELFVTRIKACEQLSEDAGWEWLPEPDTWIGYDRDDQGPVTAEDYVTFMADYLRLLVDRESSADTDGTPVATEYTVYGPDEAPETGSPLNEWQLMFEVRGSLPETAVTTFTKLVSDWDDVTVDVEEADPVGFTDHTLLISFEGLDDLA